MCVLSGRGLCYGPIPRPEESYRLWCVSECDQVKSKTLDTCCEQVEEGRTAKRNDREVETGCQFVLSSKVVVKIDIIGNELCPASFNCGSSLGGVTPTVDESCMQLSH
jgi:hypothetical protein